MRRKVRNYSLLGGFDYYTPGWGGLAALAGLFAVGLLISSLTMILFLMVYHGAYAKSFAFLISYPITFIPVIRPYVGGGLNLSGVDFNTDVTHEYTDSKWDSSISQYKTTTKTTTDTYSYSSSGVGVFGGAGVMFNRASSIALFLEVKYFVNFYKLEQPVDRVSEDEWYEYSYHEQKLPKKSSKLFQGFMFDLKFGYGF